MTMRRYVPSPDLPKAIPPVQASEPAPVEVTEEGAWTDDVLEDARRAIVEIMRTKNPNRHSATRLQAAKLILTEDFLTEISDDALLAEVQRRTRIAEEKEAE